MKQVLAIDTFTDITLTFKSYGTKHFFLNCEIARVAPPLSKEEESTFWIESVKRQEMADNLSMLRQGDMMIE